jgi:hypothetical protein
MVLNLAVKIQKFPVAPDKKKATIAGGPGDKNASLLKR